MTKNCTDQRQRSRISEGRVLQSPKILFVHKRIVKIGLSCDGIFVDIQCCPLEMFAI